MVRTEGEGENHQIELRGKLVELPACTMGDLSNSVSLASSSARKVG